MPLNYIPPKNMVTEEFIGTTTPQGKVFLQPVFAGPKYNLHYKDLMDKTTFALSTDTLLANLPSYDTLVTASPATTKIIGLSFSATYSQYMTTVYAKRGDHVFKLKNRPWNQEEETTPTDDIIVVDAVGTDYGKIKFNNYSAAGDKERKRIATTYSSQIIDLDVDTVNGDLYIKLVDELNPTISVTGYRTYEYYSATENFTDKAQGGSFEYYVSAGRETAAGRELTQNGPDTSGNPWLDIISVEGSKIQFKVIFPAVLDDFTGDPIMPTKTTKVLDGITEYIVEKADTLKVNGGSFPLIYLQTSVELIDFVDPPTFDQDFYISYREMDLNYNDKVTTVDRDSVETYFPYNSIVDKLGKMCYLALESGAQVVNFIGLPYDEEYESTDLIKLGDALTEIGEENVYYIVNYDYKNDSHPTIKTHIETYSAQEISKPRTAILSISLSELSMSYESNTLYEIANAISDYAHNSINYRKEVLMWPDIAGMASYLTYIDEEFGELITDAIFGNVVEGQGMFASAAYAGLRCSKVPQQGLTNSVIPGLLYVKHSSDTFNKTLPVHPLNVIASGGVTILFQETPTSFVTVYHQLSTKMDDVRKKEFSKTVCYDFAAYYLLSISPVRGTSSWTDAVIGYEKGLMQAGCKQLVKAGVLTFAEVGTPVLENDELSMPIIVESPTPDNYKVINLRIRR